MGERVLIASWRVALPVLAPQMLALDPGTIGRLVLEHDDSSLGKPDTEMDVRDSLRSIGGSVVENEITSLLITSKGKAGKRILQLSTKSQRQVSGNQALLGKLHGVWLDDRLVVISTKDTDWHLGAGDCVLRSGFDDAGGNRHGGGRGRM